MITEKEIEELWSELTSIKDQSELRIHVFNDIISKTNRYKILAHKYPYRLFKLLGGEPSYDETINWARVYSYEEYILDNDEDYDSETAKKWDLVKESTERAIQWGFWYVTSRCILKAFGGVELPFLLGFTEGIFDEVIDTPYYTGTFPGDDWVIME